MQAFFIIFCLYPRGNVLWVRLTHRMREQTETGVRWIYRYNKSWWSERGSNPWHSARHNGGDTLVNVATSFLFSTHSSPPFITQEILLGFNSFFLGYLVRQPWEVFQRTIISSTFIGTIVMKFNSWDAELFFYFVR